MPLNNDSPLTKTVADEEMSDSEMWKAHKEMGQQKRASNRESSAQLLTEAGITFKSKNGGAHLIVDGGNHGIFNFWPGTGLWMRSGAKSSKRRNYGVRNLIHVLKGSVYGH